jgi:predicted PurR-regulated permease PerM
MAAGNTPRSPRWTRFVKVSRRYLAVTTVFGLIVAVVDVGFLWLAGVPSALL